MSKISITFCLENFEIFSGTSSFIFIRICDLVESDRNWNKSPQSHFKMASLLNVERFSDKKFFFPIQKLGWRFIGFWLGSDNITRLQILVAVLNSFEVLIYCVFQFNFCYVNRDKLVVVLDAATPLATQFTTALKILLIVWHRRDLKIILDFLKDSFYYGEFWNLLKLKPFDIHSKF